MDAALLLLRLLLALVLFAHATQKTLGWFGGNGLAQQADLFTSLGLRPGRVLVRLAAGSELTAALLLALGLLTPLGALVASGTMVVAGLTMQLSAGSLWNARGGGEYPYLIAVVAVALAMAGPGAYSLDTAVGGALEIAARPPVWTGAIVAALALVAALPFAALIRRNRP